MLLITLGLPAARVGTLISLRTIIPGSELSSAAEGSQSDRDRDAAGGALIQVTCYSTTRMSSDLDFQWSQGAML